MRESSKYGNINIDIDDKYFDDNYHPRKKERAVINLKAVSRSVSLFDIAEAVKGRTRFGGGILEKPIDTEKYPQVDVYVTVYKTESICIKYRFIISDLHTANGILLDIANQIKL